jgi:hypothetical protein
MGEGQQDSIWQWFIRPHVCRKIENQTAKVTLKIIRIVCMDMWLQLFHVELHHGMLTGMLLTQMQIQLCWEWSSATKHALASKELQDLRVLPKRIKMSVHQYLFQSIPIYPLQLV